ncbi:Piso0_000684 [Millerozyma farinosa CBS 7064]|uniref:Piso0_000684 protein n=1 Tax=Pichia sorbitophila (strain ATCC MYA-4447 / BCRC 22081 / CBS 7064 / NBRC 10061 / NRRL Y-12695) TaxID=559304 RepID=G8YR84_PICSO|nr:Piso0_000684 [Millerozyma farinosa CBS 7064]
MGGSQLKQLKSALKDNGLVGQTNVKRKNKRSKTPSDTRRNDRDDILKNIRQQFNQFDNKYNRTKKDITTVKGGNFVKVGSQEHYDATKSASSMSDAMRMQYEMEKKRHGKTGSLVDRRFGEKNKHMTAEEKMLERFTKEQQRASRKKVDFSLASDDEDNFGEVLTHGGKTLEFDDDDQDGFVSGGNALGNTDVRYRDNEDEVESEAPPRKKSKNEVMKEIIAKSKFYKHQRQVEFQKAQDEIQDLDEDFGDVMAEINKTSVKHANSMKAKKPEEMMYDEKVRELTYDRRAVPADRTKTGEELRKEKEDHLRKLEEDRINRMNGDLDDREAQGDDLDNFWNGSDEERESISASEDNESYADSDESGASEGASEGHRAISKKKNSKATVLMPSSHESLLNLLDKLDESSQLDYVNKIIETYHPRLAEGNKAKLNNFVNILYEHLLYLSDQEEVSAQVFDGLLNILKKLLKSFNEEIVEFGRNEIDTIQNRISNLKKRDLVFFATIGSLFSTSDHYHLIVTPTVILMNEKLSKFQYAYSSVKDIAEGVFISEVLLQYQRLSKRYIPEVMSFFEKALLMLVPEPTKLNYNSLSVGEIMGSSLESNSNSTLQSDILSISDIFQEASDDLKGKLLLRIIGLLDISTSLWIDKSSILDIIKTFKPIVDHLLTYFKNKEISNLSDKYSRVEKNAQRDRKPLALQHHRALAIPTFAPKFEENFNPDKKSYDVNKERQELNKIKNELKKERKATMKDLRRQNKFIGGEQIKDKKKSYEEYHRKMANIVSSISTIEGAEKNSYEKEKKLRKKMG